MHRLDGKCQKNRFRRHCFADTRNIQVVLHTSTIMRLRLWFVLILAFFVGMGCAVALRTYYFEADPRMVQHIPESTAKILIATQTIPSGIEITADFVAFQDVPLSEVPSGALTSFAQVYRRQAAYPIPEGCPICEDLLLASVEAASQAGFVPTGTQRVTLGVVHVRQGNKVFPPQNTSLSTILATDQSIDVRVVPRDEAKGRLAAMKNEVLQTFATRDSRNLGEIILENATIYEIDSSKDSLTLLLAQNEAAKLTAAAKKGHLQIITRHDKRQTPEATPVEGNVESIEQSQSLSFPAPPVPVALPFELPLSQNMPHAQEQSLSIPMEPAPIVSQEKAPRVAPLPMDIVEMQLPPTPVVELTQPSAVRSPLNLNRFDRQPEGQVASALPNLENGGAILIRNDAPMVSSSTPLPNVSPNVSSVRPVEREASTPMMSKTLPTDEPESGAPTSPYVETIMGQPRVSQAIQFLPPGTVRSTRREYSPATAKRTDSETPSMVVPFALLPPEMLATSPVIPAPQILSEKTGISGYSPFERCFEQRVFTVHQDLEWGGSLSGGGIPTPPLLLKGSNTGVQTE